MKNIKYHFILFITIIFFISCNKDVKEFINMQVAIRFDSTQQRLDNLGNPSAVAAGNAAQSPTINNMAVHYMELMPDEFTQYKSGAIIYKTYETTDGGSLSIDFDSLILAAEGEMFFEINLKKIPPGTYNYIRASVAYQNYDVNFNILNIPVIGNLYDQTGTVASLLGSRTYIRTLQVNKLSTIINADKDQGFWAFETGFAAPYDTYNSIYTGQAPEGATTVVNPITSTSPIPPGSCVITGKFATPLVITGDETQNIYITLSFSTNESFEWIDTNGNGKWDIDASNADATEQLVDMGLRGLIPTWEYRN